VLSLELEQEQPVQDEAAGELLQTADQTGRSAGSYFGLVVAIWMVEELPGAEELSGTEEQSGVEELFGAEELFGVEEQIGAEELSEVEALSGAEELFAAGD